MLGFRAGRAQEKRERERESESESERERERERGLNWNLRREGGCGDARRSVAEEEGPGLA